MSTKNTDDLGLVVPVDMAALCVGLIDQEDKNGTITFAGATTVYTNQSGQNNAFVGTNVVRPLSTPPWQRLTTGIHLHWALPNALTRGANNSTGGLSFSTVPNRWLISRIVIGGDAPVRSSWVVESDILNDRLPPGQLAITLPVKKVVQTDPDYKYAGRYKVFDKDWKEPNDNNFKTLTGQDLSAVSSGDSTFAAFYPNSRSLFGFQDLLSDLKIGPDDPPVDVMYEVTGWFASSGNDPLSGGKTKAQLNSDFKWTYNGESEVTGYSLYSGVVQNISWSPYKKYVVGQANQAPVNATLAIGNTPPEAFAAYFKNKLHSDIPFFETLLNAFQNGLLSEFIDPKPDQLAHLSQVLHQKTFASYALGTIYQIVRPEKDSPEETDIPLPLILGQSLNQLNIYQQQCDFYTEYTASFQWQLFSDWYRMVNATDLSVQNDLFNIIYNNIGRVWPQIQATTKSLNEQLTKQKDLVNSQIKTFDATLQVKETSPARYWYPNEPVVLVVPDNISNAVRSRALKENYDEDGYLLCRTTVQLIQQAVVNSTTITTSEFSGSGLPAPNNLPRPDIFNQLLLESLVLNTVLASALTGMPATALEAALEKALKGAPQDVYTFEGTLPSVIEVNWWHANPWFPIFSEWTIKYAPLEPTEVNGQLRNYTSSLFTANYAIDQNNGGAVTYTGTADPSKIDFGKSQQYRGSAIVSNSAAVTFREQLEEYLAVYPNTTLQLIADELKAGVFASNAFSGFNSLLSMQQQSIQLNINVTQANPYYAITQLVAQIAAKANTVSPTPNGYFNPIRAGFLEFNLSLVDIYGQKRTVDITKTVTSTQLTTSYKGSLVPNIVYVPPAIAQPNRLLFRWISAIGDEIQEMNIHPSTTPICGWFLPNHLDGSLFIYDQQGRSMGTLGMNGDRTAMVWQSAPGNNSTINQPIEQVFALQNPQLRALALALYHNGPLFFTEFWKAVDSMHNFIDPHNYAQNSDLAVLIGRPVALAQAMLRLEMDSIPVINQSYATITSGNYTTDNQFTKVDFPVILGDLKQINDGLIGYFLQKDSKFDFSAFYTEGALDSNSHGVIKPVPDTIRLTASPKLDSSTPYNLQADAKFVLMLFDPRAVIHATTGILPTKAIDVPSNQYADTLGILEMTFLTTPVLKGVTGFNMPLPEQEGYQWSWVEETLVNNKPEWEVIPDISYTGGQAIADYTPQTIYEGWLRLNPDLLRFELLNERNQPAVPASSVNTLHLVLTNRKPAVITFTPGALVAPGADPAGSIVYLHLGVLVDQANVSTIVLSAVNWSFKLFNDARYGYYWAATPLEEITLASGRSLTILMTNVKTTAKTGQVQMYFDYLKITGLNDGVDAALITVQ